MSEMAETHQSAMVPYVAMAEARAVRSARPGPVRAIAVTAVFREAFVVKVEVQACVGVLGDGGGGEGDGGGGLGEGGGGKGDGGEGEGDESGGDGQLPGPQSEP